MEPIEFLNYERMSDDLYYLGPNVVLRFNVGLASYRDGKRYFFHREFEYEKNGSKVTTIRRSYDYYLSLENLTDKGDGKEYIIICVRDYYRFKSCIEECIKWFTDKKYKSLFVQSDNNLVVAPPIPNIEINSLPGGKYIRCDPAVIEYGQTINDKQPGVAITLSNPNNFVNMTLDNLMGLYYIISNVNMVMMAQNMLAYLSPPISCNRININDGTSSNYYKNLRQEQSFKTQKDISGIIGRRIKPRKDLESLE